MMSRRSAAIVFATAAIVFAACSSGGASTAPSSAASAAPASVAPSAAGPASPSAAAVEIDWYHIQNNDPGKALWQTLADEYTAAHPNVKINLDRPRERGVQDEAHDASAGAAPRLTCSSHGAAAGCASRQKAGLVKDISADVSSWASEINPGAMGMYQVDGKQYGIPFDLGMVGFWYNKAQFATAGITTPPATWDDLLADVGKLQAAKLTPFALAGKDTWTGAFFWAYLAVRECGKAGMDKAVTTGDWSDPCFVKAGADFKKLIDLKPFQQGALAAPWDGAGSSAASMAKRRRRDPADGPVAARHGHGQLRRQEGHGRQPRLVRVPVRGRRAR